MTDETQEEIIGLMEAFARKRVAEHTKALELIRERLIDAWLQSFEVMLAHADDPAAAELEKEMDCLLSWFLQQELLLANPRRPETTIH